MKKLLLFIITFAILSVGITATLIFWNNKTIENDEEKTELENVPNNSVHEEKTLDLYGMHNENDIEIKEFTMHIGNEDIEYPQISGLKNKNVENRINETIKTKVTNQYQYLLNDSNAEHLSFYYSKYQQANFSNVLSIPYRYYYQVSGTNESKSGILGLNFNLINGEELKFEDIFKSGEDISIIARMGLYKYLADESLYEEFSSEGYKTDIHYDYNKQTWMAKYHWYDMNDEREYEKDIEYVPPMTDYEIEKKVKRFVNLDKKNFYFSSSQVIMDVDGAVCNVNLFDIPEKVVIYDKYLTNEDIYENNNIGCKGIINCSAEPNEAFGKYKETKYESDNLFYDINAVDEHYSSTAQNTNHLYRFKDKLKNEEFKIMKAKIDEYKKIAEAHPEKAYFVFLQASLDWGTINYSEGLSNMYSIQRGSKVITCDIQDRKEVLDEVLSAYRYYNLGFYGTIYQYMYLDNSDKYTVEDNTEKHYYDVYTGKEITSIEDVFEEGIDYRNILRPYLNDVNSDNAEYSFTMEGIEINDRKNYKYSFVRYDEIKEFVRIHNFNEFVLEDSSTRIYSKEELKTYSKDQLNIAYNEIFARYGHDFKTESLKDYFEIWDWYVPVSGKLVSLDELNETEKANISLIREVISEKTTH